jgi:hypothetical protein
MHVLLQPRTPDALPRAGEHGSGASDSDEPHARAPEGQRDAARAASELQHPAAGVERQVPPERDVAAAERARVLPVVERRVVVPAFPAL